MITNDLFPPTTYTCLSYSKEKYQFKEQKLIETVIDRSIGTRLL